MILVALVVKIRDGGSVRNKGVYIALAIDTDGQKDVLGMWIAECEGAGFRFRVITELKLPRPRSSVSTPGGGSATR